jgi:hypothetical protein
MGLKLFLGPERDEGRDRRSTRAQAAAREGDERNGLLIPENVRDANDARGDNSEIGWSVVVLNGGRSCRLLIAQ